MNIYMVLSIGLNCMNYSCNLILWRGPICVLYMYAQFEVVTKRYVGRLSLTKENAP